MLFPTFTFAVFFAIVLPLSWFLRDRFTAWKLMILGASYVFYGYWDWRFLGLLAGMTFGNEVAAVAIHRTHADHARKVMVTASVGLDLAVLGFFKYYGYFTDSLESAFVRSSPDLDIVLPIGISFYTFQAISYVVAGYRSCSAPAPRLVPHEHGGGAARAAGVAARRPCLGWVLVAFDRRAPS